MGLVVYLFVDGTKVSFSDLSGQEVTALEDALRRYGELDTSDDTSDYAELDLDDEDTAPPLNTKITIRPKQYGLRPWGKVEVEFRKEPDGGRRRKKKTRTAKRLLKKTRKSRKSKRVSIR